jgi:alpha-beta hydrolase superfamily lysophospholipase
VAQEVGAVCLTFDLAAHGESSGVLPELSVADHLADVIAAYDALADHVLVDAHRIGVCGASYGAYLAVLATSVRRIARLILRAPALYNDSELSSRLDLPRRSDPDAVADSFMRTLRGCSMPTLVLESEDDDVIPHSVIRRYLENLPQVEHAILRGAKHSLVTDAERAQFIEWIVRFFSPL